MKPHQPIGIDAILARMPLNFVDHARKAAEHAHRLRAVQVKRFKALTRSAVAQRDISPVQWQDTALVVWER